MSMVKIRLRRCTQWTGCPGAAKRRDARERPAHGCQRLVGIPPTPRAPRHDSGPVLEVGGEHAMETREIQARPRHQGSPPGDKVQRLQHHVGRPIPERLFVLVHNPAPASLLLLMSPVALGGAVVKLVALVLVVTGVVQLTHSLRSGTRAHKLISAALGATVDGVGVLVWVNPELGSGFFAALLMIFFVVNGLWKPTQAKRFRRYRGWV